MSEEPKPAGNGEAPTRRGGLTALRIALAVLVVLIAAAAGGAATWMLTGRAPAEAAGPDGEAAHEEAGTVRDVIEHSAAVGLQPFVVNLADADAARYLRVTIHLMVDKEGAEEILENAALVAKTRDVILQTLSRKKSSELRDAAGRDRLREEIRGNLAPFYTEPELVEVLFTEFVIQL